MRFPFNASSAPPPISMLCRHRQLVPQSAADSRMCMRSIAPRRRRRRRHLSRGAALAVSAACLPPTIWATKQQRTSVISRPVVEPRRLLSRPARPVPAYIIPPRHAPPRMTSAPVPAPRRSASRPAYSRCRATRAGAPRRPPCARARQTARRRAGLRADSVTTCGSWPPSRPRAGRESPGNPPVFAHTPAAPPLRRRHSVPHGPSAC